MTFTAAKLSTYLFQIAAIENSGGSSHGTASGSDAKVQQLQQKCDLLQKKLDAASVASLGSSAPTGTTFYFSCSHRLRKLDTFKPLDVWFLKRDLRILHLNQVGRGKNPSNLLLSQKL